MFHAPGDTLSLAEALLQTAKDLGVRSSNNSNTTLWAEGSTWDSIGELVGIEYPDYYKVVKKIVKDGNGDNITGVATIADASIPGAYDDNGTTKIVVPTGDVKHVLKAITDLTAFMHDFQDLDAQTLVQEMNGLQATVNIKSTQWDSGIDWAAAYKGANANNFDLNLASFLGIDDESYFYQVRDATAESVEVPTHGIVYTGKPLKLMPAVAKLYKFMHDLNDGDLLSLKDEVDQTRDDLGVRVGDNATTLPNTIWNTVYTQSGTQLWNHKIAKLLGIDTDSYYY